MPDPRRQGVQREVALIAVDDYLNGKNNIRRTKILINNFQNKLLDTRFQFLISLLLIYRVEIRYLKGLTVYCVFHFVVFV